MQVRQSQCLDSGLQDKSVSPFGLKIEQAVGTSDCLITGAMFVQLLHPYAVTAFSEFDRTGP